MTTVAPEAQPETQDPGNEPTVIRPLFGRSRRVLILPPARPVPQTAPPPPLQYDDAGAAGQPPLIVAAAPLLNLARQIGGVPAKPDLEGLRWQVIEASRLFERRAAAGGVPPESARAAHYALCATIDDVLLNTPWGTYTVWARQGMVSTFHMDVTGGERFFDLLEHLHRDPGNNRDVLLLMYYCLSLGFEGRMRINPQGPIELGRVREGLYRTLRRSHERELSPHWQGCNARHRPPSASMALWAIAAAAILALALLFVGLNASLNARSDAVLAAFADLPPNGVATLRPVTISEPEPPRPRPPVLPPARRLQVFLEEEIARGLVTVSRTSGGLLVRIRNRGLFATGSATVQDNFVNLLDKIGAAIAKEHAKAIVTGHTDNVPINTPSFPSNWELSEERARQVGRILARQMPAALITTEGRGQTEPIDTNDTPEGREANRRTEIVVIMPQPGSLP
jgi:type VI secretion system protein ImpK